MAAAVSPDGLELAENFTRFLVIGGGLSGLSAAAHFARNGVKDFKMLEARNRLGGRVMTAQIGEIKHLSVHCNVSIKASCRWF